MDSLSSDYLGKHKKFRINSKKLATVFLIAALIVSVIVFWWLKLVGITVTSEAFCGLEEHTHTEGCYVIELKCGLEETADSTLPSVQTTTKPETAEESDPDTKEDEQSGDTTEATEAETTTQPVTAKAHKHTIDCYTSIITCPKKAHTHSSECFPDNTADVETVGDWLSTIDDVKITNNIPENLVAIAMTQLGYKESTRNFEYNKDGDRQGYTRYGEWYGNPYGKWNTMFVSFCLHYANINNCDELKSSGAEALRLAWQQRRAFAWADEHSPKRGDIVFIDTNNDTVTDSTGIILSSSESKLVVISGDSNDKVEMQSIDITDDIIGYGLTDELYFAKDMEYEETNVEITENSSEVTTNPIIVEEVDTTEITTPPLLAEDPSQDIIYITDLTQAVQKVTFQATNSETTTNDVVYIGQTYTVSVTFSENNKAGTQWVQFSHNDEHYLTYHIPQNIVCEPFTSWHPITAKTENGTVENVGEYFIDENGYLLVKFIDVEEGVCFGQKYSNVSFTIDFTATVGATDSSTTNEVVFNNQVTVNIDGGAGMVASKKHGTYNSDDHTVDYTIKVEATHGVVKDLVLEDIIYENHQVVRDSIVVTDLDGNVLDPQPVITDCHIPYANLGFSLSGFPDFAAGDGFLITYKSKINDNLLSNETVGMWNEVQATGKDSNDNPIKIPYTDDWISVSPEKMTKDGRQTIIIDANGESIPVIEWEVAIRKNNTNLQGTVIIDTLGEGLQYYTDKPILIKHYDEWGNNLKDVYMSWDEVTINGNSMSFPLPEGYTFDIFYYTTYTPPNEGEQKQYTNSASATINGKYEVAGGEANVVGFIPEVRKSASGTDGKYVYFTIEAEIPGEIKDWGSFYLTDMAAFWGYNDNEEGFLYAENMPQDLVIAAVTESGRTVNFYPYREGGTTENTYTIIAPATGDLHHSFLLLFNTSKEDTASSKWILSEDSTLIITYKLPFDAKTGTEWTGELTGDKTIGDLLLDGYKLANEAYLNYTNVIQGTASSTYEYSPKIIKNSAVNADGTIDYQVTFRNTIPGTYGNGGYINYNTANVYFTDTFDEKLSYVEGSLVVTCYDPWRTHIWLNKYTYNGAINSNTINIPANQFTYTETNPAAITELQWSGLERLENLEKYYKWMNNGGEYVFTYKLKVKDEYLYTTEENIFNFDNTAEIVWDGGSSGPVIESTEFKTGLADKQAVQENNKLKFDIHINSNALDILKDFDTITVEDIMTPNLSVYWNTIKLYYEDENGNWIDFDTSNKYKYTVTYDQVTNKLTFVVPDELHIRIDYTTLITESGKVSVNNSVSINGSAQITDIFNATFNVQEHSGGATGSMHNITLLKQDGDTNTPLPNATFQLYGPTGDPDAVLPADTDRYIHTENNVKLGYIGTYTTGADGTVYIENQYLTLGGPYALVEKTPPSGYDPLSKPVYFYFYETDPNGIMQTVTTIIAVSNYTYGFVLPETGGTGTLPLAIVGFALMAFPILYSTIRRKRERRLT